MASGASPKMILLKAKDGEVFEVEPEIAKEMQTVQSFIDDDSATVSSAIPLLNVFGRELARIIKYCRQHRVFRESGACADYVKEFDAEFVKALSDNELKELMLAANYLNVKELLDFLCNSIADLIQNKSVEFVRQFFGIVNDYTPEEEDQIRRDCAWAFDGIHDED